MLEPINVFSQLPNNNDLWLSQADNSLKSSIAKPTRQILTEREIQLISAKKLQSLQYDPTLFSIYERNYCQNRANPLLSIAGLWCAKVAFTKLTTKKLRFFNFTFLDLEINHHHSGQPRVLLRGKLSNWYAKQNLAVEVAIAHQNTLAAAIVLCFSYRDRARLD